MCLTAKKPLDYKKKTSISPNSREIPLIRKTGWGGAPQKERERRREDAVFYEKGG